MEKHPMQPGYGPEDYEWPDDARTPMTETEAGQSRAACGAKNAKNAKNAKTDSKKGTEGGVCRKDEGSAKDTYVVEGKNESGKQETDCGKDCR